MLQLDEDGGNEHCLLKFEIINQKPLNDKCDASPSVSTFKIIDIAVGNTICVCTKEFQQQKIEGAHTSDSCGIIGINRLPSRC